MLTSAPGAGEIGSIYTVIQDPVHQVSMRLKLGILSDHNGTYIVRFPPLSDRGLPVLCATKPVSFSEPPVSPVRQGVCAQLPKLRCSHAFERACAVVLVRQTVTQDLQLLLGPAGWHWLCILWPPNFD